MGIVAKYKFDGSVYADLIPEFNAEFTDYTVTDEIEGNIITRTIESDSLPTLMRFGSNLDTYVEGSELALLEVLDMNTSGLTSCRRMFRQCKNLTSITCGWDTSNVTTMYAMFANCQSLTSLDVSNFNTSNVTSMYSMFYYCQSLTSLDVSNFNTSNVTNMFSMFRDCNKLTSLDVSNFNTSNVADMSFMFFTCSGLTSLDLSNFNTSKVNNMQGMFTYCTKLTSLDVSNFDTNKVTNYTEMFLSLPLLTDIGMIYCDKSTINKVASLLPTDHNITIWVESDDILQYDQYDHITYKTQKVQDTVHLNSPLLKGDTIEVIDGKTYHVHRYEKVVLDGTIDWWINTTFEGFTQFGIGNFPYDNSGYKNVFCDRFLSNSAEGNKNNNIFMHNSTIIFNHSASSVSELKQWLQENPTTVIYKLATPYYELISEDPLELTLLDTTDNTINNNSILPSNMTIANKELSTIAIKPSTTYTLSFDKSNEDSEVTIDICSGEQITTVLNRIELTTPSELGNGIRFISSDGCIISNVRLLEGSLVKEAIPKETFEGLKSSFEDGYIIGENLITTNVSETGGQTLRRDFSKRIYKNATIIIPSEYVGKIRMSLCRDNYGWFNNHDITNTIQHFSCNTDEYYNCVSIAKADITLEELANLDIIVLEGDHTHLSVAELMRYIEKGTSHYEEEDYNHVGKYKVEYKVTGKNKFNTNIIQGAWNSDSDFVNAHNYVCILDRIQVKPNTSYIISKNSSASETILFLRKDYSKIKILSVNSGRSFTTPNDCFYIKVDWYKSEGIEPSELNSIQLEEGTVATEYEPYKEDIKTYYLSSPLLEGDTIEDINGVATHVKRRWIEKLDGTRDYTNATNLGSVTRYQCGLPTNKYNGSNAASIAFPQFPKWHQGYEENWEHHYIWNNQIYIFLKNEKLVGGIKQWLSKNPTTLIYELASPIYEPISTESILLDSYTNGHLDLSNKNIPIQKTEFRNFTKELAYLQPSTDYVVKFSSDNIGIAKVYLDSSVKEINVVKGINEVIITTPSTIVNNNIIIDGIGFNVSDVQVVANAIKNGDIRDFDYFKGLQSSFEDGLITDENDENYGKYKVDVKVTGKNKYSLNSIVLSVDKVYYEVYLKKGQNYVITIPYSSTGKKIEILDNIGGNVLQKIADWVSGFNYRFTSNVGGRYYLYIWCTNCHLNYSTIQLEEGTQATPYEPYKESIHTLYLNSPLLKGDKLVVHDGKLCHYHKMGMVVLDGSEKWTDLTYTGRNVFCYETSKGCPSDFKDGGKLYSDTKPRGNERPWIGEVGLAFCRASQHGLYAGFATADEGRTWIKNPTTVVYELAEPYYEPIEPQLSQYSFSAVKDGDMEIITALPIEKINLTYRTDINGVSSIEEQIASIQEGADISSIIDEEVDE